MQNAGYAALQIIPSFDGFQGNLERGSSGALIAAGSSGGRKYGDAAGRSMVSSFASHARRAALLGGAIITGAGYAAFQFGKGALAEAEEAQKVGALTAQVIKTTGQAANVTAGEVGALSEALSNKTGVDDEVIQRGANMLLTFKNIRNEVGAGNDIFSQSVAITEDMAAAMAGGQGGGQLDLKSSSILVGKALNDPVKGLTALTRVGVSFTDQQKKNIESLVEQNKQSEAQKIILGELQSEFGGAAQAQATLGEKVGVAWGNIQERVGKVLLPMVHDLQHAFLRQGVPALERFSDWFRHDGAPAIRDFVSDAKPKIADFIDDVRPLAEELLPAAASVLGDVRDILGEAAPYAADLIGAFNEMPDWAKKGLAVGGLSAFAGNKLGLIGGSGGALGSIASLAKPLPVVVTNPGFGAGAPGSPGAPLIPTGTPETAPKGGKLTGVLKGIGSFIPMPLPALGAFGADGSGTAPDHIGTAKEFDALFAKQDEFDAWFKTMTAGTAGMTEATRDLIAGTGDYATEIKGLPRELVTKFVAPGLVENRHDALQLVKQYDLTPKEKRTLFQTVGIPLAKRETQGVLGLYQQANQTYTGDVRVNTGDSESRLLRILNLANSINRLGAVSVAVPDIPSPSRAAAPRSAPRRGAPSSGPGVYRDLERFVDDRVSTHRDLDAERGRAGASR